jgi:hypothetical protein
MRETFSFSLVGTLLILAIGCGSGDVPKSSPFHGKLDAAGAISDSNTRDAAVAKIAKEATTAGEIAVAKKALSKISDVNMRDSTASTCVDTLVQAGKSGEAADVAKGISDSNLRDAALRRVAGGKAGN